MTDDSAKNDDNTDRLFPPQVSEPTTIDEER